METTNQMTKEFLAYLWQGGKYATYDVFGKNAPKGGRHCWVDIDNIYIPINQNESHVYFSVNPAISQYNSKEKRGGFRTLKENVKHINCLYGDFDFKDFHGNEDKYNELPFEERAQLREKVKQHILSLEFPPSVIVFSGGGYHCYWLLKESATEDIGDVQKRWVGLIGSDEGAKDLARILRLPGTVNWKYDWKPVAKFLRFNMDVPYDYDTLREACEHIELKKETKSLEHSSQARRSRGCVSQSRRSKTIRGNLGKPSHPYVNKLQPVEHNLEIKKVITTFNKVYNINNVLEHYGYEKCSNDEYIHPLSQSRSNSVKVDEKRNESIHMSSSDYVPISPFDLFETIECKNKSQAVLLANKLLVKGQKK